MPLLGCEIASNTPVTLGDIERRSSLYVLGKPGTGKSTLLKSLLLQDMQQKSSNTLLRFSEPPEYIIDPETKKKLFLDKHFLIKLAGIRENLFGSQQGVSDFFLDPHGETIDQIIKALPVNIDCEKIKLLDPANNDYAFGINPLSCPDITSFTARQETFNKTYTVFKRLWEKDAHWGVWLRLILENMLPLLIETNYTLAEGNLFLTNKKFRFHVLQQIKYNTRLVTFWQNEFKEEQAQAAITRISSLLSRDYVAHILGQKKTTLSFDHYVNYPGYFILRKLPPTLDDESRHFIGTIIVSELQHAIMSRKDIKHTFCLYLDEFQLFATDEFAKFISEGRKFGCSTTLAHQEREGQFGENEKILGATMACANKVIFQCTVKDARELAPEFAEKPTATETRMIPELVISKDPMWDLLRKGHPNKKIQDMGYSFFIQFPDNIRFLRDRMEEEGFIRMAFQDQATVYRDVASIYGTQEREEGIWRGIDIGQSRQAGNRSDALSINTETIHAMEGMLAKVLGQHGLAREQIEKLKRISAYLIRERDNIIIVSMFLTGLMEGDEKPEPGKEEFAQFLKVVIGEASDLQGVVPFFIELQYGDPTVRRCIPAIIAMKHFRAELEGMYVAQRMESDRQFAGEQWDRLLRNASGDYVLNPILPKANAILLQGAQNLIANNPNKQDFMNSEAKKNEKRHQEEIHSAEMYIDHGYAKMKIGSHSTVLLSNLPSRFLTQQTILQLKSYCLEKLLETKSGKIRLDRIKKVIEFCQLIQQPENHIKVASGVYREVAINMATTQEMVNRAVQELTELPRFTAMAKLLTEEDGRQSVKKATIALQPPPQATGYNFSDWTIFYHCQKREDIAREIAKRAAAFEERKRGKEQQPKAPLTKGHSDPPDQPEPPPQGWVC